MGLVDRIALAIDFSRASEVATRAAFAIAEMVGAESLTLLHSVRQVVLPAGEQPAVKKRLEGLRRRIHAAAENELVALCEKLEAPPGLAIDYRIVEGRPADAIPEAAHEMGASLLMVGTHSRRGVGRWLKGSIAEAMLRRTKVPMLVLLTGHDETPPDEELRDLSHVLIAVDLAEGSSLVARAGLELAGALRAKPNLVLLHVSRDLQIGGFAQDDPEIAAYSAELRQAGEKTVRDLAEQVNAAGLDIEVRIADGDPNEVILDVARALPAHLIVVGTHGRDLASRLEVGSTTAHVVRHSDVAVLVVPSHPEEL